MQVLPGPQTSRCSCPETGMDIGGGVKEGHTEAGRQEAMRQGLGLQVRAGLL